MNPLRGRSGLSIPSLTLKPPQPSAGAYSRAYSPPPAFRDGVHRNRQPEYRQGPSGQSRNYTRSRTRQLHIAGAPRWESTSTGPVALKVARGTGTAYVASDILSVGHISTTVYQQWVSQKTGAYQTVPWGFTWTSSTHYSNYIEDYWPCAGGISAVNATGTQMRDPIHLGLIRWRMTVKVETEAPQESGGKKSSPRVSTRFSPDVENERADAGREGGTCLATPNSWARAGSGKNSFLYSTDH